MNRYIITRESLKGREYLVSALYDENKKLIELSADLPDQASLLGNIYIGRVENIVKNINAAFVKISAAQTCYLSLEDAKYPVFTKKNSAADKPIAAGDELLVQVTKEAVGSKEPTVTTNLSFPGRYAALTGGNKRLSVSAKLSREIRADFLKMLEERDEALDEKRNYGIVIRTNAAGIAKDELLAELTSLEQHYKKILDTAKYKTAYSLIYTALPPYQKRLMDLREKELDMVVTDERSVFEEICTAYAIEKSALLPKANLISVGIRPEPVDEIMTKQGILLKYYRDEMLSLSALYSLKEGIHSALSERVWLKSGAYLIIQPTEALTVIDVNTGKNISGKDVQKHFLSVNKEAAAETARQLRLRNISGIILVDFINLTAKEDEAELLAYLRSLLKKDPVPAQLIDMTKLGLVEITRKKVKKSLRESI